MEGADARVFAQAQFCGDVGRLRAGHWQWNAWLDHRGRVQALMQLADAGDDSLLAFLRGGDAERIGAGLARYVLRARVTLRVASLTGRADGPLPDGCAQARDDGSVALGFGDRSLRLERGVAAIDAGAANAWRRADIRAGWPTLPDTEARFLPPALGLGRLGAIAFDKGCYPGQEIATRLHRRGGHKHRLCHLHGDAALAVGAPLRTSAGATAWVLDCAEDGNDVDALAVAPSDTTIEIKIMDRAYKVVSMFPA